MEIVWDEPKRLKNLETHKLDFAMLSIEFLADAVIVPAKAGRLKAIGRFENGMIAVIFVRLGTEAVSVISMRRASRLERRLYEQARS